MKKNKCKNCDKEFIQRHNDHIFCSRSCSMLNRHKDTKYTNNIANKMKATKNTDKFHNEQSIRSKKQWDDLKKNNPDEFLRRMNILNNGFSKWISNDKNKKYLSDKTIEFFKDNDKRKHLSNKRKEYYEIPENRQRQQKINKEIQNRPDVKEKQRSHWKCDLYAENRLKQMYNFKNYTFPSGRIVSVQGYENYALDELLKSYDENDIVVATDGISIHTGVIEYELNGTHIYKPDIYIKSKKLIIEVKSDWTYKITKKQTRAKEQACKNLGFNFYLMIL